MMKRTLAIPCYDGKKFTWSKWTPAAPRTGFVDASDLGLRPGQVPGARIWDDTIDLGFQVRGTFETKLFVFDRELRDEEDEIVGWIFDAADGDAVRVQVNND